MSSWVNQSESRAKGPAFPLKLKQCVACRKLKKRQILVDVRKLTSYILPA